MKEINLSPPEVLYGVAAYALVLPLSLLLAAMIWAEKVSGVLYLCTDSMGIFDFIPPFVHPGGGDIYIAPRSEVYLVWASLIAAAVLLPAAGMWLIWRVYKDKEDVESRTAS